MITRVKNKVHHILLKHNLQHERPTKSIDTNAARKWLRAVAVPDVDRLELDMLLDQWEQLASHLKKVGDKIDEMHKQSEEAAVLASVPGLGNFASLAVACRIGNVKDFPRPTSLSNFFGLTPGCCNSGDIRRPGSITKEGSSMVRFLLGNCVLHVLRKDAWMRNWYKQLKRRRGAKIARVAVMRRLVNIIWHMLQEKQPYIRGGPTAVATQRSMTAALGAS